MPRSGGEAAEMVGLLQCELPNARLHSFEGRLSFHSLDGAWLCCSACPYHQLEASQRHCMPCGRGMPSINNFALRCSVLLGNDKSCCNVNRCRVNSGCVCF